MVLGVTLEWYGTGIYWIEARDASKHPIVHKTASKNTTSKNNNSVCLRNPELE
jgi:hypothetical protein